MPSTGLETVQDAFTSMCQQFETSFNHGAEHQINFFQLNSHGTRRPYKLKR